MAHPCGHRPTRRRQRRGPNRLVSWRWATPLRRSEGPASRAGGPVYGPLGTFGEPIFDDVEGQDTRERPHGQDQLRECLGRFDCAEPLLHGGIIMTYAVAEA